MSQRRSENESAFAGIILFAVGIATIQSLGVLPLYNSGQVFLVALVGGGLIAGGLWFILRSVLRRTVAQ
jgi:hypothetical protein